MNNNNRANNNRRRGRGNRPGGNGGQQLNRIDSRARGNAPQLLEKYRKLAQDAHLNGDRVTAEYYLQFADHYFRVLADARVRQEEGRLRRDDRWQGGAEDSDDTGDFAPESDFPSFDQPSYQRREREDRVRQPRPQAEERFERSEEPVREEGEEDAPAAAPANRFEPPENPFLRENRGPRGLKPRRDRDSAPRAERDDDRRAEPAPAALDPASLPPAIAPLREENAREDAPNAAEAPKPRRGRPPKRKPSADDAGEALESVG